MELNLLTHVMILNGSNLEPRSPTARRKGDLVKFDFEHAYWQQGRIYAPCCYCACLNELLGIFGKVYVNNGGFAG